MEKYVIFVKEDIDLQRKIEDTLLSYHTGDLSAWVMQNTNGIRRLSATCYFFEPKDRYLTWASYSTKSDLKKAYPNCILITLEEFIVLVENNFQEQKEYNLW